MVTASGINHGRDYKVVGHNSSITAFHCRVQLVYTNRQGCLTLITAITIKSTFCWALKRKCTIVKVFYAHYKCIILNLTLNSSALRHVSSTCST